MDVHVDLAAQAFGVWLLTLVIHSFVEAEPGATDEGNVPINQLEIMFVNAVLRRSLLSRTRHNSLEVLNGVCLGEPRSRQEA